MRRSRTDTFSKVVTPMTPVDIPFGEVKEETISRVPPGFEFEHQSSDLWKVFIDNVLDNIVNPSIKQKISLVNHRILLGIANSRSRSQASNYIKTKITEFANNECNNAANVSDRNSFCQNWTAYKNTFQGIDTVFSPLNKDPTSYYSIFTKAVAECFSKEAQRRLAENAVQFILENNEENAKICFDAIIQCKLYTRGAFDGLLKATENFASLSNAAQIFNKILEINDGYLSDNEIYEMAFILSSKGVIPTVDSLNLLFIACIIAKSENAIDKSYKGVIASIKISFYKLLTQSDMFETLDRAYKCILKNAFIGQYGRRILLDKFKKDIGSETEQFGRLIGSETNKLVRQGPSAITNSVIETLAKALDAMNDLTAFENIYLNDLIQRVITAKSKYIEADTALLSNLANYSSSPVIEKAGSILEETKSSLLVSKEFIKANPQPILIDFIALSSYSVTHTRMLNVVLPEAVLKATAAFTEFYHTKIGNRTLAWNPSVARVCLSCQNVGNIKKIKCDGFVASLLLALNDGSKSVEAICDQIKADSSDVEKVTTILSQPQSGSILIVGKEIAVNEEAHAEGGFVDASRISGEQPTAMGSDGRTIASRDSLIDRAIITSLKGGTSEKLSVLIATVQSQLGFPLGDDVFQRRIKRLVTRQFLSIDGDAVRYVP